MLKKIGRRKFMKGATSAFLGMATVPLLSSGPAYSKTDNGPSLEYRTLGRTGLEVTSVSMGVMNCSDSAVIHRALDLGVNFFDTARRYMGGRNEELLGKALMGKRDKVFIQTKLRFTSNEKTDRRAVEASLKSLKTDYIDVLLAHSLKTPGDVCDPAMIDFLEKMKKEGKARFTGFSSHSNMASLLREAAKAKCHDVALVSYNYTHSDDLKEAIAAAANAGIGIVAMKTQAGGYTSDSMKGLSPHQASMKYVLLDHNVATAVPGVTTIAQIEELTAVMGKSFSRADSRSLSQYDSIIRSRICSMCGGCEGACPNGVNHTDILRAYMYNDGYGNQDLLWETLNETGFRENIEHCSHCDSCSITCSRGLDIRSQLRAIKSWMA